jgi:integrase
MEQIELNKALQDNLVSYMESKQMPYNTKRTYGYNIGKLFRQYSYIGKDNLSEVLKKMKHQNQRAILNLINRYCFDNNIDFRIIIPKMTRIKKKITAKILSPGEVDIMISSAPKPYNLMLKCIFKIGGGLRISEAIRLGWHHFSWSEWLDNGGIGKVTIINSKGDDRVVNVPIKLMEELHEYAKEQGLLNEFRQPAEGLIFDFGASYKQPFKPDLKSYDLDKWKEEYTTHAYNSFVYHILKKHCIPALGKHINIHQLRHTRATQLYSEENIPLEIIQQLLGHKEIETTMIYTKITPKKVFEAMKDIE